MVNKESRKTVRSAFHSRNKTSWANFALLGFLTLVLLLPVAAAKNPNGDGNPGNGNGGGGSGGEPTPPSRSTYTAEWIGGWSCAFPPVWVTGSALAGVTHAEFPITGTDVGRKFGLEMTLTETALDAVVVWQSEGSFIPQLMQARFGAPWSFSGDLPSGPGTLIVDGCGSTDSSAVLTIG